MIGGRGPGCTAAFGAVLAAAGIRAVLCDVAAPRMNAIAGRWIGGCRREVLDRALLWNQSHLRRIRAITGPTAISAGLSAGLTPLRR